MLKVMYDNGFKAIRPKIIKKKKNFDTPIKRRKKPHKFWCIDSTKQMLYTRNQSYCVYEIQLKNHCIKI